MGWELGRGDKGHLTVFYSSQAELSKVTSKILRYDFVPDAIAT
jgi:hypothetical protein